VVSTNDPVDGIQTTSGNHRQVVVVFARLQVVGFQDSSAGQRPLMDTTHPVGSATHDLASKSAYPSPRSVLD